MTIAGHSYKKIIVIGIIIIVLTSLIVHAFAFLLPLILVADFVGQFMKEKPSKLPWYEVQQWELDVCSKWGGRTQAEQSTAEDTTTAYGDATVSLQARKIKGNNEALYEITYFIESYTLDTDYIIRLTNEKKGLTREITRGKLGPATSTADFWAQYLPEEYTTITLDYAKGPTTAPVVEVR